MFLLSSALKNEDFIFKKKEENNIVKKTPNELLCGIKNQEQCNHIIRELELKKNKEEKNIIDANAYDDLELFKGIDKPENSVIRKIDKTKTIFGRILLKINLNNPTIDIDKLKKSQKIIKQLLKDDNIIDVTPEAERKLSW